MTFENTEAFGDAEVLKLANFWDAEIIGILRRRKPCDGMGGRTGSEPLETSEGQKFLGKVVAGRVLNLKAKKR